MPLLQASQDDTQIMPVPYRCILINDNPKLLIKKLANHGIQAINPLETWELLGDENKFLSSLKMTQKTLSLPCYPSLTDKNLKEIELALNKINDIV